MKTDAELITEAQVIRDETAVAANSKLRIYNMFKDIIESKKNNLSFFDIATGVNDYSRTTETLEYTIGDFVLILFNDANTGPSTLDEIPIKKNVSDDLDSDDIKSGEVKLLTYDGTNLQIVGGSGSGGGSGTVESVTGDGVDNTDPDNPVLSFPTPVDIGAEVAGAAAAALSDAENYTDAAITQEVIDRDAAISTALSGLSWKNARVATTANITLSGTQTIDGVSVIATNRVLVKNQSTQSQNGVYVCAAGAWSRATDSDTNGELQNAAVLIAEGTAGAGTAWVQTQSSINIGSTNVIFQQLGASVPNADSSTRGIAKLYTATGINTDGSMDQNSITSALSGKQASLGYTAENTANKDATGGYAGLTLFKINFKNALNTFTSFFTNSNTAARTYTFQDRNGTIADDTDLAAKAPLASPTFTGTPSLPTGTTGVTQSHGDNSTKLATTAFVQTEINSFSNQFLIMGA